jgi:hypothetical protein
MVGGLALWRAARPAPEPEEVAPAGETAGDRPPRAEALV